MKDFKTIKKDLIERRIKAIFDDPIFSKTQLKVAKEFNDGLIMAGAKGETRRHYLTCLKHLTLNIKKEYRSITKKDIEHYIVFLSKKYKKNTIKDRLIFVKSVFFVWLYQKKTEDLQLVNWIKIPRINNGKLPEEILSQEDIKNMVQVANTLRNKAMIFTLYESGCRKGEFLGLKIKHVTLDNYGAVLMVDGKTGSRRIRLIDSVPDLINWLNAHPGREDPESPLWINEGAWLN